MKEQLDELKQKIATFRDVPREQHARFDDFVTHATVALAAGGEGMRFRHLTDGKDVHKTSYLLPSGETMIERTISLYRDIGIKRFVALVYHNAQSIVDLLGDGSDLGVSVEYSYDPEHPVGRGGALKHALVNSVIDAQYPLIVHNPDDQIVGDVQSVLSRVVNSHLYQVDQGAIASVVVVDGTHYAYTGMNIQDDVVSDIVTYPFVPIPAHTGLTLLTSEVFPYFDRLFDLDKKTDFEPVLFPELQKKGKLFAVNIPRDAWIPVNDEKGLKKLVEFLD